MIKKVTVNITNINSNTKQKQKNKKILLSTGYFDEICLSLRKKAYIQLEKCTNFLLLKHPMLARKYM